MKRVALQKAADHLDRANDAVDQMAKASDFKTYERAWVHFLAEVSRFYSKMEQGTKGCKVSEPWFGAKKYERKKDHLLSYIHHARDCEEHTIDHTAAISADGLTGQTEDGKSFNISFDFMVDDKGRRHYRNTKATGYFRDTILIRLSKSPMLHIFHGPSCPHRYPECAAPHHATWQSAVADLLLR